MANVTENRRQGVGNITIDTEVTENGIYPVEGKGIYAAIAAAAGMTNPMTAKNDIIVGGTSGAATRLAKGANGTLLGVNGSGDLAYLTGLPYVTTAPTEANTQGIKLAVLSSDPPTKYSGWFYIITGA